MAYGNAGQARAFADQHGLVPQIIPYWESERFWEHHRQSSKYVNDAIGFVVHWDTQSTLSLSPPLLLPGRWSFDFTSTCNGGICIKFSCWPTRQETSDQLNAEERLHKTFLLLRERNARVTEGLITLHPRSPMSSTKELGLEISVWKTDKNLCKWSKGTFGTDLSDVKHNDIGW